VRAPISGRITHELLHEGEIAGPGIPVCVIIGTAAKDWRIKMGLIDRDWAHIKTGNAAMVELDAYPQQRFPATVSNKSMLSTDASGMLDIELKFIQQPSDLAVGMICKVTLPGNNDNTLTSIPIDALTNTRGDQATVFSIEEGKAKAHLVKIDRLQGNDVVISAGLTNLTEVITIGALYLEEGDSVIYTKP
jgi:multidrug efflux pump subunit AcrA (membrane-fusion protein)